MFKTSKEKIVYTIRKIRFQEERKEGKRLTIRDVLCNKRGSHIVEYLGIAAGALIIIALVVLPGMKTLFNVDVFPGLTTAVNNIFKFS